MTEPSTEHPQPSTDRTGTLRIETAPWDVFQETALETAGATVEGEETGDRLVAFKDAAAIQRLLTPKRLELLKSVMGDPPGSLRALAERLERSPSEVHGDVHLLEEYGIIKLKPAGRAKRPVVPYDSIEIEVTLSLPD
ncbi:MAG: transcriptional regulator [Halobacteriales archaeon]